MTAEQSPTEDVTSASPGAMLQEARKNAKLSLEHVASELRMTPKKVQAIEEDDFSRLPTQTFVRGYLRSYAKLVKLDPEEVLAAFRRSLTESGLKDDSDESPLEFRISRPKRPLWHFGVWVLILLAAIWLGSLWFVNNQSTISESLGSSTVSDSDSEAAAQAQPNDTAAAGSEVDGEDAPEFAQPGESAGAQGDAEQAEFLPLAETGTEVPADSGASVETSEPTVQVTPMAAVAEVSDQGLDRLQLEFSDECWLVVTDARGDVLHTDLMQAGQSLSLSGVAPFEVKLGNARAAQLTLNGEPVEFEARPDTRLMTLAVGE